MHRLRFVVPFAVLVLIAAACTSDEGGGGETGGATGAAQEENTGTVNVLSALAAEEADTLQTLWDDTYGSQVDYQVEFEGVRAVRGAAADPVRRRGPWTRSCCRSRAR